MNRFALLASIATLALACVPAEDDPTPAGVPASAEPVARSFTQGSGIIVGVGTSLASTGNGISDDAGEEQAKSEIEEGIEGNGDTPSAAPNLETPNPSALELFALTNPECVTLTWSGLTATITYDQCMSDDGNLIDGALTLGLQLIPLRFFVAMDALRVDATTYDGEIGLAFTGTQGNRSVILDADFSYSDGTATSLDLADLSLSVAAGSATVNGAGSLQTAAVNASFDAASISWDGECLPTSGSLTYADGQTTATITFLSATPATGEVIVTVGTFTTQTALLPPCT